MYLRLVCCDSFLFSRCSSHGCCRLILRAIHFGDGAHQGAVLVTAPVDITQRHGNNRNSQYDRPARGLLPDRWWRRADCRCLCNGFLGKGLCGGSFRVAHGFGYLRLIRCGCLFANDGCRVAAVSTGFLCCFRWFPQRFLLQVFGCKFDQGSVIDRHALCNLYQAGIVNRLPFLVLLVLGKDRLALFSLVGLDGLEGAGCLGRHPGYGFRLGVSGCFRVGCRVFQQGALSGCLFPWRLAAGSLFALSLAAGHLLLRGTGPGGLLAGGGLGDLLAGSGTGGLFAAGTLLFTGSR